MTRRSQEVRPFPCRIVLVGRQLREGSCRFSQARELHEVAVQQSHCLVQCPRTDRCAGINHAPQGQIAWLRLERAAEHGKHRGHAERDGGPFDDDRVQHVGGDEVTDDHILHPRCHFGQRPRQSAHMEEWHDHQADVE